MCNNKQLLFPKFVFAAFGLALLAVTGCGTDAKTANADKSSHSHDAEHGHDHEHGHSHSHEGHSHGVGPHGGTVADWGGGKFHVEFTVDHNKQEATVYVLGTDEKTTVPIDAAEIALTIKEPSINATLKASPQEGDPEGKASRFVGTDKGLGVVREYEGSISGVVDGTPYSGTFKEEPHGHKH